MLGYGGQTDKVEELEAKQGDGKGGLRNGQVKLEDGEDKEEDQAMLKGMPLGLPMVRYTSHQSREVVKL